MSKPLDRLFGLQAARLSDLIGQQGREAYATLGIELDARLNSTVMALYEMSAAGSTDIANRTGISRQLVESRIRRLEADGLVLSESDPADARRRLYRLNPAHDALFSQVHQVMAGFEAVYEQLWTELGIDIAAALRQLEDALEDRPLSRRFRDDNPQYPHRSKERV